MASFVWLLLTQPTYSLNASVETPAGRGI